MDARAEADATFPLALRVSSYVGLEDAVRAVLGKLTSLR